MPCHHNNCSERITRTCYRHVRNNIWGLCCSRQGRITMIILFIRYNTWSLVHSIISLFRAVLNCSGMFRFGENLQTRATQGLKIYLDLAATNIYPNMYANMVKIMFRAMWRAMFGVKCVRTLKYSHILYISPLSISSTCCRVWWWCRNSFLIRVKGIGSWWGVGS